MRNITKNFKKGSEKIKSSEQNKKDVFRFIDEGNPNTHEKISEAKIENKNQKSRPKAQLDEDEEIDLSTDIPSHHGNEDI